MNELRNVFPVESKVYCIVRHVSTSKNTRIVSVLSIDSNGIVTYWSSDVASLLGLKMSTDGKGIILRGNGMNMLSWLVGELSKALYGSPFMLSYREL